MSDLGTWTAEHVTYICELPGEMYDANTDELMGRPGQVLMVCDSASPTAAPTMPHDQHGPSVRKVSAVADGVGRCECGRCGGNIEPYDEYCRHCGVRFMATVYEMGLGD